MGRPAFPMTILEYLVGDLLLRIGHRIVEGLERCGQALQTIDMRLGEFPIGLQVVHCGHGLCVVGGLLCNQLLHGSGVIPHRLRDIVPVRLLAGRECQLCVQTADPLLDGLRLGSGRYPGGLIPWCRCLCQLDRRLTGTVGERRGQGSGMNRRAAIDLKAPGFAGGYLLPGQTLG